MGIQGSLQDLTPENKDRDQVKDPPPEDDNLKKIFRRLWRTFLHLAEIAANFILLGAFALALETVVDLGEVHLSKYVNFWLVLRVVAWIILAFDILALVRTLWRHWRRT